MRLKSLTSQDVSIIDKKKIYYYEKSDSYLSELLDKYDLLDNIVAIIDDFKRNQGVFCLNGKKIDIVGTEYLENVDFSDATILITSDYYKEAFDKLSSISNVSNSLDVIYFYANRETEIELEYREKYENRELENIIVFRSGPHASSYVPGMDFADNARALFEYMLSEKYNEKYELVWLVKNPDEFARYNQYKNVRFLSFDWSMSENQKERDEYYRVLCLAKYFFFTDAYGFVRNCREDQIRVQLWHGCGFKTRVNFVRCEKRYEYTTVISDLYARIHADIYGLRDDQVLITGYAKQDWLFHPISEEKLQLLGVPRGKKYIFWLPTFRTAKESLVQLNEQQLESETGLPIIYTQEMMRCVDEILEQNDMVLVIKLHPFQDRNMVHCDDYKNIVLLENEQLLNADVQINEVLGWADALISDYSSAAVDYLLLNRPIAFTLDDVEEYESSRGFVFDPIRDWLPGVEVYNAEDFCGYIEEIAAGIDRSQKKRNAIRNQMYRYFDDGNCERILETLEI